jgi:hypothetical protein
MPCEEPGACSACIEGNRKLFVDQARAASCVVCLGEDCDAVVLCCSAAYHLQCLGKWLDAGNKTCPGCRHAIQWDVRPPAPPAPAFPWFMVHNLLNEMLEEHAPAGMRWCGTCMEFHVDDE